MTIHGPGFGLSPSVAFLAQIAGLLTALTNNDIPSKLEGFSFVERDFERSNLLAALLRERFASECYAQGSPTGNSQILDVKQLQSFSSSIYSGAAPIQ